MKWCAEIRTPEGGRQEIEVEAADRTGALAAARREGGVVLGLREGGAKTRRRRRGGWLPMKKQEQETGLRQIAAMLKSGLPLLDALRTAADPGGGGGRSPRTWGDVADGIERGRSLAEAMEETGKFDTYTLALTRVGEQSGELDTTLVQAADALEKRRENRALVVNALFYPVTVGLLTAGVVWFMMTKVIPQMRDFIAEGEGELPEVTQALISVSDWIGRNGPAVLTWAAGAAVLWWLVRRTAAGREWTDALLLRVPLTGKILRLATTATLARSLSILLESGLTLMDGLEVARGLFRNRRISRRLAESRERIMRGSSFASTLEGAKEFMPMLARMAATGEATGTLGTALAGVADFHEAQLKTAIRRFGMLVEPVLIFIVGGIVGFVYVAFFMALFSLAGGG